MGIRKYIGDRAFYKMALSVAVPIMIQNFITNLVSMLDNLMVGAIGTQQMSGVSIVNQLIFIFNIAVFGALSGAGIFTAQFHGKSDNEGIRYTVRYKIICALALVAVAVGIFSFFGDNLISLYLHDENSAENVAATLGFAKDYLKIILWGLLPFAISQVFSDTLRETEETLAPMVVGFVAVFTNCILNFLLIFGKLGFPVMGVRGAAIATVISRYVECFLIVIYTYIKRERFGYIKGAFRSLYIPSKLLSQISLKGLPLLANEFFWSLGMSLLSLGYSLYGINVVAGYSISSTVINLFNIAFLTLGSSIGIIVGKQLGAGEFEKAVDTDRKLITFSLAMSVVIAVIVILTSNLIPQLYKTNDESKMYAAYFIRTCGYLIPAVSFSNAAYFTLRCGGKTMVTVIFDSVFVMCVSVPAVFLSYYAFGFSIWVTFFVTEALEILKAIIGIILVKKRVWVNNIVG